MIRRLRTSDPDFGERLSELLAFESTQDAQVDATAAGDGTSRVAMNRRHLRPEASESILTFDENARSQSFGKFKVDQPKKIFEPAGVIDLATLTGACVIALGEGMAAGIFSGSDAWCKRIMDTASGVGERLWQMPLFAEYGDKIKSDVADIKNGTGRMAGVGTSAYFLKRFVEQERNKDAYPWAHVDMAGMMFNSDTKGYQPKGAMGFGVRTLVELAP